MRLSFRIDSSKKLGYLCATRDQECIHSSSGIQRTSISYKRKLQHARHALPLLSRRRRGVMWSLSCSLRFLTPNPRLAFLADTACQWTDQDGTRLDSARVCGTSLHAAASAAAASARQARDDDAEQRDDGVDDGLESGGNGVDDCHDAVADRAEDGLDLVAVSACT